MMRKAAVILVTVFLCHTNAVSAQGSRALPHVLVYKTRSDYSRLVPVQLSGDKTKIVSYPGPGDIKTGGAYALPVLLHKGYLLDRRGIGTNSAFLKYSYEEYGNLKDLPPTDTLYTLVIDKDPLTQLYDCGIRNDDKNSIAQLNKWIDKKQLRSKCTRMK
jgi:hypothetical protein